MTVRSKLPPPLCVSLNSGSASAAIKPSGIPWPWTSPPKQIAITDEYFHLFHVAFFTSGHPCGPMWAHMASSHL